VRGQNISRDNNIRSTGQSDTNNRRSTNQSNINSQRSSDTARGAFSYTHGGRGRGGSAEPEAVGPGGKRIVFRGGHWVDPATGKPVQ
jgi:hypothetical protein